MLNSLDTFLDELISGLRQPALMPLYDMGESGISKGHGGDRARFAGYFLPQLLKEFSILRETITETLYEANVLSFDVQVVINRSIDATISLAATEFAFVQQQSTANALQKAEASNRDLEHFAALAAHDLKSPLATISSYLDLLKEASKERLEKESFKYIESMEKISERMRNFIDQLLDYANLARLEKSFQPIQVDTVLDAVLENLEDDIAKTKAKITRGQLLPVSGNAGFLIQLFQNLIANSIKFRGDQPPEIEIDSSVQDSMILYSIKDNGRGFDSKDKEEIFTLYKKLRAEPGTGIGLATCRKVVELHGGKIWAESQPGLGATFYVTLPKAAPAQATNHH